ncbi:MAG: endonuclease/exonuclease/phosphatase family protein [Planctomycetes bacterium]|nr:endonuclease/exonuclease/phosphatase family protein [Planctomycetota bacterium]
MTRLSVMTWNVLFGGQARFQAILDLVAARRPDVLVLQECLGWEEGDRFARVAAALGLPATPTHAHLGRGRPRGSGACYHVAVYSRLPLLRVVDHADPALIGHVVVEAHLEAWGRPLVLLGTHFDAHDEDLRLVEARHLRRLVTPSTGQALLLGDLNALSRRDPYTGDLARALRRAGVTKYGDPPRFDVMDELEAQGWVDALRLRPAGTRWVTAPRERKGVRFDARTDYVLASSELAARLVSAEVVPCDGASDHEPVVAEFA